jgi:hypothetical protein
MPRTTTVNNSLASSEQATMKIKKVVFACLSFLPSTRVDSSMLLQKFQ